jgi:hypothetical protein
VPGQSGEGRKQFFFEKKNQKTFAYWARACGQSEGSKSFLPLFFKKEDLSIACLPSPDCPGHRALRGRGLGAVSGIFQKALTTSIPASLFHWNA